MTAILMSSFAILSACAIWHTWRGWYRAEQRAASLRELADAGRAALDLAHDLGNMVAVLHINMQTIDLDERQRAQRAMLDVQAAALAVHRLFAEWRGSPDDRRDGSSAGLLAALCGLVARTGVEVVSRIEAPMPYDGSQEDVVRVLQHVLLTASRDAVRARDPRVEVEMGSARLHVRYRAAEDLDEHGLATAKAAAGRLGWRLARRTDGEHASFVVQAVS